MELVIYSVPHLLQSALSTNPPVNVHIFNLRRLSARQYQYFFTICLLTEVISQIGRVLIPSFRFRTSYNSNHVWRLSQFTREVPP